MTEPQGSSGFPTTRWGRVVEAAGGDSPEAGQALAELCRAYWYPIYAFVRRRGHGPDDALDLTQDFFARLLERNVLASADPGRGRFRTFLRAVCSDYLSNRSDRDHAEKRGGGRPVFSIDAPEAEGRYVLEPSHERTPEWFFERDWALTLLGIVLDRLRREYQEASRAAEFEELRVILTDGPRSVPYATIAGRLGTSEGAVAVAVHRLRRRYGELLRAEIEATVDDPAEVDDEVRALFAALRP
jgi:RNA polymerase sigma-70 factor (ECF subfamily)